MAYRQHSHNDSTASNSTTDTLYVSQPMSPSTPFTDKFQDHRMYKAYQTPLVGVEDVSLNEPSVASQNPTQSSNRWSGRLSEKTHLKPKRFSKTESWFFEISSLCVAIAAISAIVGILASYDGRPLSSWRLDITLNAMIALLATAANAGMAVPLSSGLSQLKWIRFKTRRTPLSDMEVFDDASRGIWGAMMMLVKLRGGLLGSFGAVVAILTLAFNPFSQQIATFYPRLTSSPLGATNLRAQRYGIALSSANAVEGFIPILPLKAAVYNGLFAENGKPWLSLPVECSTGECSWDVFDTLGVCNHCIDMSDYMTRYCANGSTDGDMTQCGWSLPSGAKLKSHAEVFSMTPLFPQGLGDMPYSTIMKLVFMGTEIQDGQPGVLAPWARQCTLDACVQTLNSSIVNGGLKETIINTTVNATVPTSTTEHLEPIFISDAHGNETYRIDMKVMMGMRSWFADLFRNGSASRNAEFINTTVTSSDNLIVNLTVGISSGETFFDTDIVQAFYWNHYEYLSGIDMLMNDLATSVTISFRTLNGTRIAGLAHSVESYVFVRWGFITVPVLAVLLTATFLAAAIYQSWKHKASLWKSSVLATLVHGLDSHAREKLEDIGGLREQLREAKGLKVKLDDGDAGSGLLQVSRYEDL